MRIPCLQSQVHRKVTNTKLSSNPPIPRYFNLQMNLSDLVVLDKTTSVTNRYYQAPVQVHSKQSQPGPPGLGADAIFTQH